jgi:hypothetical protein
MQCKKRKCKSLFIQEGTIIHRGEEKTTVTKYYQCAECKSFWRGKVLTLPTNMELVPCNAQHAESRKY